MTQRRLEPLHRGLSDADIVKWDVGNWSRGLAIWRPFLQPGDRALLVGERDGGLSSWFAAAGVASVCSDLVPLERAARDANDLLLADHGGSTVPKLSYVAADVTSLGIRDASFDVVAFKSLLPAVQTRVAQVEAVAELARVLKPGGKLLMIENLTATPVHRLARRMFVPWSRHCRYLDRSTDRPVFADFDLVDEVTVGVTGAFGRTEAQRDRLGRIDQILEPVLPESFRYVWSAVWERR